MLLWTGSLSFLGTVVIILLAVELELVHVWKGRRTLLATWPATAADLTDWKKAVRMRRTHVKEWTWFSIPIMTVW